MWYLLTLSRQSCVRLLFLRVAWPHASPSVSMRLLTMIGRSALCSPRLLAKATRAALPALTFLQQPLLSSTVASLAVKSSVTQERPNYMLPMLAAGAVLTVLAQPPEPAHCGKKRKKGTVVEEFYNVDYIKARRVVKGSGVEYLVSMCGARAQYGCAVAGRISPDRLDSGSTQSGQN
mgnify:CR=1 FL=1